MTGDGGRAGSDSSTWHDRPSVVAAAGIAALLLLGLLIYAVIHVGDGSSRPPLPAPSDPVATSRTTTSPTGTTSYAVPSVQTSENTPVPSTPPPPPASEEPEPEPETSTETTTTNPYATTTTQNADAV